MRVRVKTAKKGQLALEKFSLRRRLNVDIKEVPEAPIIEDGRGIWPAESKLPEFLQHLVDQIVVNYNLGDEIESFNITHIPPNLEARSKPKVSSISKAPMGVAARIVFVAGSRESFNLAVSTGGVSGDTAVACEDGDSFSVPIGVSSAIEYTFNDAFSYKTAPRKGFREMNKRKDPTRRHIFIIDGMANPSKVMDIIKNEALRLGSGNTVLSKKIEESMAKELHLDVEAVVAAAQKA